MFRSFSFFFSSTGEKSFLSFLDKERRKKKHFAREKKKNWASKSRALFFSSVSVLFSFFLIQLVGIQFCLFVTMSARSHGRLRGRYLLAALIHVVALIGLIAFSLLAPTADAKSTEKSAIPYTEPTPSEGGQVVRYNLTIGVAKRAPDCFRESCFVCVFFIRQWIIFFSTWTLSPKTWLIKKLIPSPRRLHDQRRLRRPDDRGPPRGRAPRHTDQRDPGRLPAGKRFFN